MAAQNSDRNGNGKKDGNGRRPLRVLSDEQCEEILDRMVDMIMDARGIYFPETPEEVDRILRGEDVPRKRNLRPKS